MNRDLADELVRRAEREQALRARVPPGTEDEEVWREIEAVDRENTARLAEILAEHGWPGRTLVGEEAERAAWLLAQHADRDPEIQREALALLDRAVAAGDADPQHLAYLTDRVAMHEGRPQRYGTQFRTVGPDAEPFPIEDPEQLDDRRASVGLPPFDEYLAVMREPL